MSNGENQVEIVAPEFQNNSTVKLDLNINITDITDMMVGEHEENLLLEKETIEGNLNGARKTHTEAEQALVAMGQELIEEIKLDKNVAAVCVSVKKFSGKTYVGRVTDGAVDIEKQVCTATMMIVDKEEYNPEASCYSNYQHIASEKDIVVKFPTTMKKQIKVIEKAATEVNRIEAILKTARKKLADMPRLRTRAKNAVVKAQLKGELTSPQDILDAISDIKPKALPSS